MANENKRCPFCNVLPAVDENNSDFIYHEANKCRVFSGQVIHTKAWNSREPTMEEMMEGFLDIGLVAELRTKPWTGSKAKVVLYELTELDTPWKVFSGETCQEAVRKAREAVK